MSLQLSHDEVEGLLGAFALDAVDQDEWEAIELHLRGCPRCRAEVAEHREVAALLAHTGAPAPDGVWSRILSELEPAPPALRMPGLPMPATAEPAHIDPPAAEHPLSAGDPLADVRPPVGDHGESHADVVDLGARRSRLRPRLFMAVAAAAAVLVAFLGIVTVRQTQHLNRLDASLGDVSVERAASQAMSDPQATTGKLRSKDGRVNAPVVVDANGKGYLLASKLPELPRSRTYQLWGHAGTSTVSLGVFDGGTDVVPFQVGSELRRSIDMLMVTQEVSPGVAATKRTPLLTGAV